MNSKESLQEPSLSEVHRSVRVPRNVGFFRRLLAFAGPAYLVSVGYMDPGNWATDLEGGARFGYQLLWVLLMSNLMAILLQTLAARLGIVAGRDLAQVCRDRYPRPVATALWVLCECAIAACDLAEVLGTAIGLNLLVGLPLIYGVILTGFDTMLFLVVQHFGVRKIEALILVFVSTIGVCFAIEVFLARPEWGPVVRGFIPHLDAGSLYVAVGILGATVMPHNLYLHSAIVQSRAVERSDAGRRLACRYNLIDTAIALNAAFFVNAAILIVAAAVFYRNGVVVTEIQQAHELLAPLLGTSLASTLFAVALISAGQSSTLTGTLAGQIVMEGFLRFKVRPVVRRLITRMIAIVPAVVVIALQGDQGSYNLLILSQVILSLQLPFAVVPLVKFTSRQDVMGAFANRFWVRFLAWCAAGIVIVLNSMLLFTTIRVWIESAGPGALWPWLTVVPGAAAIALLLVYVALPETWRGRKPVSGVAEEVSPLRFAVPQYRRIGVALDYGVKDATVLSHALTLGKYHRSTLFLFHVVEGVGGQLHGTEADDREARDDAAQLDRIANQVRQEGLNVVTALGYGRVPNALVALAGEQKIDVLVMGGHGHRGLQDILFGASISEVRHKLEIPVLVVQ
jgi:manganese transport protein